MRSALTVSENSVGVRVFRPDQRDHVLSLMMRKLLTDRFQLAAHKESREVPAYDLVVSKAGPKLREGRSDDPALPNGRYVWQPTKLRGRGFPWRDWRHLSQRECNTLSMTQPA